MATVEQSQRARYVCPLCERTLRVQRAVCPDCASTIVVPLEDGAVYETVLPMCGR